MPGITAYLKKRWVSAILAATGMCLFALFIHKQFPLVLIAAFGLFVTAFVIAYTVAGHPSPALLFGITGLSRRVAFYSAMGLCIGAIFAVVYRTKSGYSPLPGTLTLFAPLASLIGITEELMYRGFIQGCTRNRGAFLSTAFAAFAHTAYKCALFAPASAEMNLYLLIIATFIGGIIIGVLREFSASVLPPVIAHACFDIIVYGESSAAPWWVWS